MKLAPKSKLLLVFLLSAIVTFALIWRLSRTGNDLFEYLLYGWVLLGSCLVYMVKCPRCGSPVVFQERGVRIAMFFGLTIKRCHACGEDLTKTH